MPILNGKLPADLLVTLGTDAWGRPVRLTRAAGASLTRLSLLTHLPVGPTTIADSYRDYARQERYWDDPPNAGGLAARPGTSDHGWALALDLRGDLLAWATADEPTMNAHGWFRTIAAELWHWVYDQTRDQHQTPESKDKPMPLTTADLYQIRVVIADEVAKLLRNAEFRLARNQRKTDTPDPWTVVLPAKDGLGPAQARDWLIDARVDVARLVEQVTR